MGGIYILQAAQYRIGDNWFLIDWNDCERKVKSLQNRIVKSVRKGEWRKVKRLRYLLTHSFAARALAVKRVTENIGKVLKQQGGLCPHCQQLIQDEDKHHLHYLDGDKTHRRIENVLILHKTCRKSFEYIEREHVLGAPIDMGVSHA